MKGNAFNSSVLESLTRNRSFIEYFEQNSCINLSDFLSEIYDISPHLVGSLEKEANWLSKNFETSFEEISNRILDESRKLSELKDIALIENKLRILKRRMSLIVACADICKIWDLDLVTSRLTFFAEMAFSVSRTFGRHRIAKNALCFLKMTPARDAYCST